MRPKYKRFLQTVNIDDVGVYHNDKWMMHDPQEQAWDLGS